ncbi:TetR/AcrR family transcriptional regulator [Aromatoleum diolicum]|uniref:TetR family transcriptional regulator n=1 Tax=Aromatoleum diolicum TaxID=75796 RepID=A0ABX1QHQ6_9RHOO|nr:TetR/AcrR family transcriptional regulator [Aromatoleum diolicum]NMG76571.1 TetR family transcriptional regulator [Aromatoleum diolicum]
MASPPVRTRSRLAPDERISEIMAVTRQLLSEKGYQNVVTSEVAERCGISEGTIYKYFDSKRELLARVAEEWFEEILGADENPPPGAGVRERLRQLVWKGLSIIRQEPSLSRFVLMELRSDPTYRSMRIYELNRRFTARIGDLLQEAVSTGLFRADVSVRLLRDMIFGCIEHRTWAYLRGEGDFSVDEAADGITNVIYRGMLMPGVQDEGASPQSKKKR